MADADYQIRLKTLGRNDDCTCGSKKKYKKCHLPKDQEMDSKALAQVNAEAKVKAEKEAAEHAAKHGHDHPHDHEHEHEHGQHHQGQAPNAQVKPPSPTVKQVSAPRKVGSGG